MSERLLGFHGCAQVVNRRGDEGAGSGAGDGLSGEFGASLAVKRDFSRLADGQFGGDGFYLDRRPSASRAW